MIFYIKSYSLKIIKGTTAVGNKCMRNYTVGTIQQRVNVLSDAQIYLNFIETDALKLLKKLIATCPNLSPGLLVYIIICYKPLNYA